MAVIGLLDIAVQQGDKTYTMNVQTEPSQDENKGLIYNHDESRVLMSMWPLAF